MKCFHANINAHTHQLVHITVYTLIVFFYDKLVVHMCIYTFTIACMYLLHECSCIHSMILDRATTNISASSTTTDQCSINCFHASIRAHTHHHVHITLYTLMFFFYDKLVAHMCLYTFTIVACIHCMHVLVFTPCVQCMQIATFVHRLRQPIYWCSMNCFLASIHAHTHHHVHKTLYTLMFFFYDKLLVHMCMYTFTIACMYSLRSCSCIHSMFSMHASTDICASSMTTDRLMFHEVFPCKY